MTDDAEESPTTDTARTTEDGESGGEPRIADAAAPETETAQASPEQGAERVTVPPGVESTLPSDVPMIQLAAFEGPLDLLLYLIRREKLDIHNIPIAPITRTYMEYLELMRELNLELAGEFMVMAATLIHIKSKMLVPLSPAEAEGDEEHEDPREELVQRLLEFERYREAAGILHQRREIRAATWARPDEAVPAFDDAGEEMLEAGLFDLISAFKELLERRRALLAHEVEFEGPSVEERMEELLAMIGEGQSLEFMALFETLETKSAMIVTFLALLELIRLRSVKVYQRGLFGPIRVFRPLGPTDSASSPPQPSPVNAAGSEDPPPSGSSEP
jgi:segregation and condensation protein A